MRSYRFLLFGLALILCLQFTVASPFPLVVRQDEDPSDRSPASTVSEEDNSRPTSTPPSSRGSSVSRSQSEAPASTRDASASSSVEITSSRFTQAPVTTSASGPTPSSSADADKVNPLPIQPRLTPALGLAGTILLISGLVYAVIGIKNKWLYVFGSSAYLSTLAVTVLIVYLMTPPVSNAVQGAFFVAAFLTGMIFGGLSLVFPDITEGLGCLLGGFCLSMWFLTLKEGGLITSPTGRAIFIGCLSAAGFSLSFSHYTRTYGLIASISFAGATVTVLGIDCFSRAGWKEFWLYLWNLNPDTFPLNTNTYPLTKYIKAELAAVILITVLALVSQLRLWKVVKEHREKTAMQRLEVEQIQEQEERERGQKVQDDFVRERAQWEATYGDKNASTSDPESPVITPKTSASIREKENYVYAATEMAPPPKDGMVGATATVEVVQDDEIRPIDARGPPTPPKKQNSITSARPSSEIMPSMRVQSLDLPQASLAPSSVPPPPTVVPLPFTIPKEEPQDEQEDNASVSAVPESVHESIHESVPDRRSLTRRSSAMVEMGRASRASLNRLSTQVSNLEEPMVIPHIEDDRASSVAATLDEEDTISLRELTPPHSPLEPEHMASSTVPEDTTVAPIQSSGLDSQEDVKQEESSTAQEVTTPVNAPSAADSSDEPDSDVPSDDTEKPQKEESTTTSQSEETPVPKPVIRQSLTVSTDPKPEDSRSKRTSLATIRVRSVKSGDSATKGDSGDSQLSKSTKSDVLSQSSHTEQTESQEGGFKGALPARMSKIALSYRTNEWAKHLDSADKPEIDDIPEPESPGVQIEHRSEDRSEERAAPVSDEIIGPVLANKRNSRRESLESNTTTNAYQNNGQLRSPSSLSRYSSELQSYSRPGSALAGPTMSRSNSDARNFSAPSPLPTNTLLSQRESRMQRRVSSQSLTPYNSSPNLVGAQQEESMSLAQRQRMLKRQKPPSASQKWQQKSWAVGGQIQGFDSHQPNRSSSNVTEQRREDLLAGWRESIKQNVDPMQHAMITEDQRRHALMNDIRQKEAEKQQQAMAAQQRESMMDNMMRSSQMMDAHREAMRRMQANANRNAY